MWTALLTQFTFLICRPHAASMTPFGAITDESSMPKPSYKWHRVLLKVSGEALAGDHTQNIDPKVGM